MRRPWERDEDALVRKLWPTHHVSRIARKLKRSDAAVARRAYRLLGTKRIQEIRQLNKKLRESR